MYSFIRDLLVRLIGFFIKKPINNIEKVDNKPNIIINDFDYVFDESFPKFIENNKIYIVGQNEYYWVIVFICPCGCREFIQLNLLKDVSPCWSFYFNDKQLISIKPSIWRNSGCKSHFFINNGDVKWVID